MSGASYPDTATSVSGTPQAFPGPDALGRGLVVLPGTLVPDMARDWPRQVVDQATLTAPAEAVEELDAVWRARQPSIVELAVPFAELKQPETCELAPYELTPEFAFARERLHFLVWANRYDLREGGPPRWHHARRALALGALELGSVPGGAPDAAGRSQGDVTLPNGRSAWIDGGPRTSDLDVPDNLPVLHVNQLWAGVLQADRLQAPGDEALAPDQVAAVSHPGGPARVLAPAGSGKTRVLTARLRHVLSDRGWTPGSVTTLAYNNRAAAELRSRTRDLPDAQVRTLHSLGYEILGRSLGRKPKLLSEWEVRRLLEPLAPVRHRANDDVYAPYIEALAEVRAALRPPDVVAAEREDIPGFADLFDDYRDRLARQEAIDHDEQIYGAVEVLLRNPEVRQAMQRRCAHVLLDELQDLTPAQLLMVRLLAAPAYDVYGVGDDDQVIYGFAGADPRFLVDYERYFPGAASFLLEVNYRCPPPVVDAASKLLAHNRVRVPKATRPTESPTVGANGSRASAEALLVERVPEEDLGERLLEVVEAKLGAGVDPGDIAVLTRVNAGLLAPQVLLEEAGVPIQPAVDERMLDRTGARAALAWLRLAMQAGQRQPLDGGDLAVAARRPPRKLSRGVLGALGRGEWQLHRLAGFAGGMDDARLRTGLEALHHDLDHLGRLARSSRTTTARLLTEVRDSVGLGGALEQLDGARSSSRGGHGDDLDALILVAGARPDPASFEPWLRETLRRARAGGVGEDVASGPASAMAAGKGVVLSTVHRVKGLEWPHVVVWDASAGAMPHRLHRGRSELEEERRVFHVALTRGQRSVTVLARAGSESRFLDEMSGAVAPSAEPDDAPEDTDSQEAGRTTPGGRKAKGRTDNGRRPDQEATTDPETTRRIEALKQWRRRRAEADKVPAFVVLNDRHLEGIAARAPADLDGLLACDGIGPTKLARYGKDILAVLDGGGE